MPGRSPRRDVERLTERQGNLLVREPVSFHPDHPRDRDRNRSRPLTLCPSWILVEARRASQLRCCPMFRHFREESFFFNISTIASAKPLPILAMILAEPM